MSLPPSLRYKEGVPEINIFFKLKDGCGTRPHEGLPHWISYFTPTYWLHSPPFLFLFPPYFSSASLTSFSQLLPRHFTTHFTLSFFLPPPHFLFLPLSLWIASLSFPPWVPWATCVVLQTLLTENQRQMHRPRLRNELSHTPMAAIMFSQCHKEQKPLNCFLNLLKTSSVCFFCFFILSVLFNFIRSKKSFKKLSSQVIVNGLRIHIWALFIIIPELT